MVSIPLPVSRQFNPHKLPIVKELGLRGLPAARLSRNRHNLADGSI